MGKTARECAQCGKRRGLAGKKNGCLLCWTCMIRALLREHWNWDIHTACQEEENDKV